MTIKQSCSLACQRCSYFDVIHILSKVGSKVKKITQASRHSQVPSLSNQVICCCESWCCMSFSGAVLYGKLPGKHLKSKPIECCHRATTTPQVICDLTANKNPQRKCCLSDMDSKLWLVDGAISCDHADNTYQSRSIVIVYMWVIRLMYWFWRILFG